MKKHLLLILILLSACQQQESPLVGELKDRIAIAAKSDPGEKRCVADPLYEIRDSLKTLCLENPQAFPWVQPGMINANNRDWPIGTVLTVAYTPDSPPDRVERHKQRMMEGEGEWRQRNVTFVPWGSTPTPLRRVKITSNSGSWSPYGTDGLLYPPDAQNQQIGWDDVDGRLIRHEDKHGDCDKPHEQGKLHHWWGCVDIPAVIDIYRLGDLTEDERQRSLDINIMPRPHDWELEWPYDIYAISQYPFDDRIIKDSCVIDGDWQQSRIQNIEFSTQDKAIYSVKWPVQNDGGQGSGTGIPVTGTTGEPIEPSPVICLTESELNQILQLIQELAGN